MKAWLGKKAKQITAIILTAVMCTACGEAQSAEESVADATEIMQTDEESVADESEITQTDEKSVEDEGEITQPKEERKEDERDVDFEVKREAYHYNEQRNDINIYYPQLTGFVDAAKEKRINALIEEDVKKWIGETNKEGDDSLYCLDLDYEVKFLNDRMISILYKGGHGYITAGHGYPAKAAATTIDMEEEKVIALKDIADVSKLGDMLLADEFQNITMWEGVIPDCKASEEIYIYDDGLDADLQERHSWYTDGEHFIIVLVDTNFSDYLEYSIDIESVSPILDETFLKKLEYGFDKRDEK